VSHTALTHTRVPAATVHVPFRGGSVCVGSLGMAVPFASFGVQVCTFSLHQSPPVQSASTLQPPEGSHSPFLLQTPDRHTVPAVAGVHGPSPLA
jgi:hypothetical protein